MQNCLKSLVESRQENEDKIAQLKGVINAINSEIEGIIRKPLTDLRALQGKDTGTITAMVENIEVKEVFSKNVKWDQELLKKISLKIYTSGDDPDRYITTKYSVPEKRFTEFPPPLQSIFSHARTVKSGNPKTTFNIKEE